jgi:4-hydroxy-2-oxoglutarate aldolase
LPAFEVDRYNARVLTNSTPNDSAAQLSKKELSGLLLPITTPFTAEGSVDFAALRRNIAKWNEPGIAGYVILGSTGERVHLDEQEYSQVIETAGDAIPHHMLLIAGAGQHSTQLTINEIRAICGNGRIDAVLVITPHFYRTAMTQNLLHDHYQAVADASPVPVMLYSMPPFTGIKIEPATASRLSSHQNIIGIKDSSADVDGLMETVREVDRDFAVMTGNGTVLDAALRAGACGAILAVGCVVPTLCIAISEAVNSGDMERAAELQSKLSPLAAAVTTKYGIGGLKAALDLAGYEGGHVRAPLKMPDARVREEIVGLLRKADEAMTVKINRG